MCSDGAVHTAVSSHRRPSSRIGIADCLYSALAKAPVIAASIRLEAKEMLGRREQYGVKPHLVRVVTCGAPTPTKPRSVSPGEGSNSLRAVSMLRPSRVSALISGFMTRLPKQSPDASLPIDGRSPPCRRHACATAMQSQWSCTNCCPGAQDKDRTHQYAPLG